MISAGSSNICNKSDRKAKVPLSVFLVLALCALAEEAGYEVEVAKQADPWPYDPDSKLVELAKEIYREQNGEEIEVAAVHAGLECGTFKALKSDLDMISIGPDLKDARTPNETLYLDSIPKIWRWLKGILAKL